MAKKQEATRYPFTAFVLSKFTKFMYILCQYSDDVNASFWEKFTKRGFDFVSKAGLTRRIGPVLTLTLIRFIPTFTLNIGDHYQQRVFGISLSWLIFNFEYYQGKDVADPDLLNTVFSTVIDTESFVSVNLSVDYDYENYIFNKTDPNRLGVIDKSIKLSIGNLLTFGYGKSKLLTTADLIEQTKSLSKKK